MIKKSQVPWTEDEVAVLHRFGNQLQMESLCLLLPRHTKNGIMVKRRRLGIKLDFLYRSTLSKAARNQVDNNNLCKTDQTLEFADLSLEVQQVLLGSLLGDGCIKKNGSGGRVGLRHRNYIFYDYHYKEHIAYTDWKAKQLSIFLPRLSDRKRTGGRALYTVSHPIFTKLRTELYPKLTKTNKHFIPPMFVDRMNLLSLLIWYLDDGYAGRTKLGYNLSNHHVRPQPSISAKGWNLLDLNVLTGILNRKFNLHLSVSIHRHRDGYNKLVHIRPPDRDRLFPLWAEFFDELGIPDCMRYKIVLPAYRQKAKVWEPRKLAA